MDPGITDAPTYKGTITRPDNCDSVAWYAVSTRSRHERVVRQQLAQKAIEAFLPTVGRWSHWKDRRKKVEWPLFPGYCFARFDGHHTLPILNCTGVVNIVSFGGRPAAISDIELNNLRVLTLRALHYDACPLITEGDKVEVIRGPLAGVIGRLMQKEAQRATVVLSVELIGQAIKVHVNATDIRSC